MNSNQDLLRYSFPDTLRGVMESHRITTYRLTKTSGLNSAHVSRLVRGIRQRPNNRTVQKLLLALARLGVSDADIDMVQVSAGFATLGDRSESQLAGIQPPALPAREPTEERPVVAAKDVLLPLPRRLVRNGLRISNPVVPGKIILNMGGRLPPGHSSPSSKK